MPTGHILYLNGVSSAGKTSICRELEAFYPHSYWVSLDAFLDMPTSHIWEKHAGDAYQTLRYVMHHTLEAFMAQGKTAIVDTVALHAEGDPAFLENMRFLAPYTGLLVQITCPLEELRRRELARGDRKPGQAEGQLPRLPPSSLYDLTLDSSLLTPQEAAASIMARDEALANNLPFQRAYQALTADNH